ncbi:hypothetical protein BDU57DRAFT_438667, partial [Ampelomyces quisqualis]
ALVQQIDRFQHNAFSPKPLLCVYRTLRFVNHSCVPNATVEICEGATMTHTCGEARPEGTNNFPKESRHSGPLAGFTRRAS